MKYLRTVLSGTLVWACVFTTFAVFAYVPGIKDSIDQQGVIADVLVIVYAAVGAAFYYKKGSKETGLIIGPIMALTALILDVLITVPFVEIPAGRTYHSFFTSYVLWVLVAINMTTVYVYWKRKVHLTPERN